MNASTPADGQALRRRWARSYFVRSRVRVLRAISDQPKALAAGRVQTPVVVLGKGTFAVGNATFGWLPSPGALTGSIHLEARHPSSSIEIEDDVYVNNGCVLIAARSSIRIGAGTLLGPSVSILDSNFHPTKAEDRTQRVQPESRSIEIGRNVFIGYGTTVLRGVTIGDGAVVGAGAVVTRSVPAGGLAFGNPCVIRPADDFEDPNPLDAEPKEAQ